MTTETIFELQDQKFELGILESGDIDSLMEVARQWVRNRETGIVEEEELVEIRGRMESSLQSTDYRYYVVRDENHNAVGCCAVGEPEDKMQQYKSAPSTRTVELVNVFLDDKYRGKGLGYRLMNYMFTKAWELGMDEVIWNSGPRYKDSAWAFYNKLVGDPIIIAKEYYGIGGDAPIWRKKLE